MNGPAIIEAELIALEPASPRATEHEIDPLVSALRQKGFRSISVGLQTVQIDGALYQLCPVGKAAVDSWLRERACSGGRIRLLRHSPLKKK
jgi:hypothetical protein